jgi:nucleotide-binding universal stress UspA family protein
MKMRRTIVVGVATVDELDAALAPAIRLVDSIGAELHVVHVFEPPDPKFLADGALLAAASLDPGYVARMIEAVVPRLEAQVSRFAEDPSRIAIHALPGVPHARLSSFASEVEADLLVVGATRRGRIWREILGTTAERVLRAARVPVLVLHQPFLQPVRRVLMTTDLSEFSACVHDRAVEVLEILFSNNPPELRSMLVVDHRVALATSLGTEFVEQLGRSAVERFLAERQPGPAVDARARVGDPCEEIVVEAQAWQADLLVLGTHGRKGLSRYVFGSVAAAVLRDANRNVLVIPASAGAETITDAEERNAPVPAHSGGD